MPDLTVTATRLIPAPPETVYRAWLDPAHLSRFMVVCEGDSVASAETDPRIGGRFSIVMHSGGKDIPHAGTYLELVPHSRIAFTWESPHSDPDSRVTVSIAPAGQGSFLTLTQVKFRSEAARDGHERGWTAILAALEAMHARAGAPT